MKVLGFTIILLFLSFLTFAQNQLQQFEPLNIEKVMADLDTIKAEMDSTIYYIVETCKILKEEVEMFGLIKTIQMNSDILFPPILLGLLYLIWLRNRYSNK
jgi:Na+-transporting methylmalonyl-CoA/oxaloacetate decarboxylase gamma subunit